MTSFTNISDNFELLRLRLQNIKRHMDKLAQKETLLNKQLECIGLMLADKPKFDGVYCNRTWDNVLCWPPTKAGTTAVLPCPDYVSNFNLKQNATRRCLDDGAWYYHPEFNNTWTNFTACGIENSGVLSNTVPEYIKNHMDNLHLMSNVGYGLSMASLVAAVIIMLYFKKLHCPRNTIHLNLFMSFILRSAVSFIRENLLVEGLGFPGDVYFTADKKLHFKAGIHWECRLFFTMFNYIIAANYTWIFVEALYLQMLISVAVFSEKSRSKWYILFGWAFPLSFIIPWVCLRTSDIGNEYCWNTYYKSPKLLWVIYGPITASIIVNFLIFINIVRLLFTKLNASPCPETKIFRYRRLAKSTLLLIPLFGVYYIVFTINTYGVVKGKAEVVMMYAELFFNSFQGFLLSLLFCFFNAEVQTEIKKVWKRHRIQRSGSKSKSTGYYHSRVTRHRHSDFQNGDVNDESKIISSDIKENSFSDVRDSELCTYKTNGVLTGENLNTISECTPCLDKKLKDETYSNAGTLGCEKLDCGNTCRNNNHTTVCEIDHSNSDNHVDEC